MTGVRQPGRALPPALRTLLLWLLGAAGYLFSASAASAPAALLIADASGKLTPEEVLVLSRSHSDPSAAPPVAIDTPFYWWVAQVDNPGGQERWVVHVGNTAIERASLYIFEQGRRVASEQVDLIELAREGFPDYTIGHHLPVSVPPGSRRTLILKLETPVAYNGLIFLKPETQAKREAYYHLIAVWLAAGAMMALIVYNLFLGIRLRLPLYLFYVGHAGGHLLYLLTALGMAGAALPVLERYLFLNIPGIIIGVLFGAVFIYRFLDLPELAPRLARIYRLFIGALCLLPLFGLFLEPSQLLTAARSSHLVLVALVLSAGITGVIKKRREALYILVGWGLMVVLTARGMLGVLGVIELTIHAGVQAFWAVMFEMFFLSLALADRVRRLSHEKEAAEQASEAKSAFLANMSHEIRTPLNGVLGMVDTLARSPMDARQQEYLGHIRQSGKTLLSLLEDVLEYSRVEAGKVELKNVNFSPRALLDELRLLLGPEAGRKGLELTISIEPGVPEYVFGDAGRLRQVLLNLFGNAIKFTERGEVNIRVSGEALETGKVRLTFSVTDTGIGIPREAQSQIFSRFHQADATIRRRYGGSGLGLAITRELVSLMNGEIAVDSREGVGSRFVVVLDLSIGEAPEGEVPVAPELPPLRILVVEDEPVNQVVVRELLSAEGHKVALVDGGAAALEIATREPFDLVLMDLSMPEMDGLEATRRLRAAGYRTPVVGLTAHVLPEQNRACKEAGMDAVLSKPLDLEKLKIIAAPLIRNRTVAEKPMVG